MNKIRKTPIQLNHNTILVLHLFRRHDDIEDSWMQDIQNYIKQDYSTSEEAAKLLIEQMEGHWNIKFMKALRDEADKHIKEWEERCEGEAMR